MINKKGQIWVESVLYTLIGLALIALVLAFVMPKINETKDRAMIEQSISSLNVIDEKLNIVLEESAGNVRTLELTIKKGYLTIDSGKDTITFVLEEITKPFTEVDTEVNVGRIKTLTEKSQKDYNITLKLDYSGKLDLQYKEEGKTIAEKKFTSASTPYKLYVSNTGEVTGVAENSREVIEIGQT